MPNVAVSRILSREMILRLLTICCNDDVCCVLLAIGQLHGGDFVIILDDLVNMSMEVAISLNSSGPHCFPCK